ncbi:ATP-grasp domain-containing protein [Rubneribacter sp.]|nr:ATP-grasp domain-containing protein [Candidatus Rubneribacter avistercoris]
MIVLEEPYASEPLLSWLASSRHPVLDNEFARSCARDGALNLVAAKEAARRIEEGERVCTNSENALSWVAANVRDEELTRAIGLFKDKAAMRRALAPLSPGLFFRTCSAEELFDLDFRELEPPFVLKPSVGFCSMGVHAVESREEWERALADIRRSARTWGALYPESVIGSESFVLEGYVDGVEYALDAYFDETGAAQVLNVLRHDFASPSDTSDRLYLTSPAIVRENARTMAAWLDQANALVGARNLPVHVEVRVKDGQVTPIEFNPLRFAGLGGTDISWHAYGYRTYEAFLDGTPPDFDAAFAGKDDKVYAMSLLNPPSDATGGERFDYEAFASRFSHVLELRPFDVRRVGSYGFLFLETDPSTAGELSFIMRTDLREFLR